MSNTYNQLDVRTALDLNASADVNQLQSNFNSFLNSTGSHKQVNFVDTTSTTGLHTESGVLKYKGDTVSTGSGGGGVASVTKFIPAGSFNYPATNGAPLEGVTGTNYKLYDHYFDDSTDNYLDIIDVVPDGVDGTYNMKVYVHHTKQHSNTGDIKFIFGIMGKSSGDTLDTAISGPEVIITCNNGNGVYQSDLVDEDTVTNWGLTANGLIMLHIGRLGSEAGDDLVSNWDLLGLELRFEEV